MNDDEPPTWSPSTPDEAALRRKLAGLKLEHADLDASVAALETLPDADQIRIARLKKRKLALRDEIARMEDALTPDLIA